MEYPVPCRACAVVTPGLFKDCEFPCQRLKNYWTMMAEKAKQRKKRFGF